MQSRLDILSEAIVTRLQDNKHISDEMLNQLFIILTDCSDDDANDSKFYNKLAEKLQAINNYSMHQKLDPETIFSIGACWAAIELHWRYCEKRKEPEKDQRLLELVNKHEKMFRTILASPGINHGNLASSIGLSPSRLTQIMAELKREQLVVASIFGREKHYSLSPKGMKLVDVLRENYLSKRDHELIKRTATYSNCDNFYLLKKLNFSYIEKSDSAISNSAERTGMLSVGIEHKQKVSGQKAPDNCLNSKPNKNSTLLMKDIIGREEVKHVC